MATSEQHQELIDTLKFVPRDVTITLYGYGGEVIIGTIDPKIYQYWSQRDDLEDLVHDWDREVDCPDEMRFIEDGSYYEIDDIAHENGVEMSSACRLQVIDQLDQQVVCDLSLDPEDLSDAGCEVDCADEIYISHQKPGTCVFYAQNFEKGTFFEATVRITKPFDPAKLVISYYDIEGWLVCASVSYDGEDLDGCNGYSTTGKSSTYFVQQVPGEAVDAVKAVDVAVPVIDESCMTPWFPVGEAPVRVGTYEVEFASSWPMPVHQMVEWDGSYWIRPEGYESLVIKQWRGLTAPQSN